MHTLTPFQSTEMTRKFNVQADIVQISTKVCRIHFIIEGPLQSIIWPSPDPLRKRSDELWKHTCLEAFLSNSLKEEDPYLEMNLSPAGNWNLYELTSYRKNLTPAACALVTIKRKNIATSVQFQAEITTTNQSDLPTKYCGLSVILKFEDGQKSYWAFSHGVGKADFHNKTTWKSTATR